MKRFIAIALVGMFSLLMVGTVYASFDSKQSIELKKGSDSQQMVAILDGVTPSVEPQYGKMVTVLSEDETLSGYQTDITPNANGPPTIRML
ncbi:MULTISPECIES: hypothetical protein [Sphingobacterium]|uniref:hypothetical protein n=1 Tax=Sphingobacterium TaxID=28453 RepID=UPI00257A54AC|nr:MULTISPECIES: hypothetical protein [Sphingobacterium]